MKQMLFPIFQAHTILADGFNGASPDGNVTQTMLLLGFGFLFFYFLLWRPEQKRRKAAEKLRNSLRVGDRVIAMGIIGIVDKVQDETVILTMYDHSKIEVLKIAVSEVQPSREDSVPLAPSS